MAVIPCNLPQHLLELHLLLQLWIHYLQITWKSAENVRAVDNKSENGHHLKVLVINSLPSSDQVLR